MSVKSVSIRIEEEMLRKIAYVADYEGRSVNSHVLVLIRDSIRKFEAENGTIEDSVPPQVNVKPTKK
ncbi:MAG: Arc family DNA-binding protein [Clostridia bacterium]|nr:Arc family DNA-binding protein [Clostridia bacterium]